MSGFNRGRRADLLATALFFGLDRLTKFWAVEVLRPRLSIPWGPYFSLSYVENTGMAFGLGSRNNLFFLVLTAALVPYLFYLQGAWSGKSHWARWGLVLVTAGALGNLYDRIFYGHVVDFLDFHFWPVFNAADSCITVGACCLAWGFRKGDGP